MGQKPNFSPSTKSSKTSLGRLWRPWSGTSGPKPGREGGGGGVGVKGPVPAPPPCIKYHALGYATRMTPKRGGIRRTRLRLIQQPLFEVIFFGSDQGELA